MALIQLQWLIWRKVNQATLDTLLGNSDGQYDIRLGSTNNFRTFFEEIAEQSPTANGGFTLSLPVQAVTSQTPIAQATLDLRFMGAQSARRDWNIPSQRPTSAYPLWRVDRAVPDHGTRNIASENHYVAIFKDVNSNYHCRWLTPEDLNLLPATLRAEVEGSEIGIKPFNSVGFSKEALDIYLKLLKHHNILLYGPPGTGKSYLMQEVLHLFNGSECYLIDTDKEHGALKPISSVSKNRKSHWVTFHQSFSYEEFVIGLRPSPTGEKLINLEATPGIVLELAEFARQQDSASLLLVDEINRGNVSRIFGEMITLLESDKRLGIDGKEHSNTVKVRLPYINEKTTAKIEVAEGSVRVTNPFTMPLNVFLLASMNSVDKSTMPLDAALRRRFHIIYLGPNLEELWTSLQLPGRYGNATVVGTPLETVDQIKMLAVYTLEHLNTNIGQFIGNEFCFGNWYLKRMLDDTKSVEFASNTLSDVWKYQFFPQLLELFSGRQDQLISILRVSEYSDTANCPVQVVVPTEKRADLGAFPIIVSKDVETQHVLRYLHFLISGEK